MRSKIVRGEAVPRAVKWVGRAERPADGVRASFADRGGLKKSVGGLESDVDRTTANVGQSAASIFQSAHDGVRKEKIRGRAKKMGVESDGARFQSAENGARVEDIGGGLKHVGVETADASFQSADVGGGLKHIGGRHENVVGGLKKVGGGLETIGVESDASRFQSADVGGGLKLVGGRNENIGGGLKNIDVGTTDDGFQSADARFQSNASLFRLSNSWLLFETTVLPKRINVLITFADGVVKAMTGNAYEPGAGFFPFGRSAPTSRGPGAARREPCVLGLQLTRFRPPRGFARRRMLTCVSRPAHAGTLSRINARWRD